MMLGFLKLHCARSKQYRIFALASQLGLLALLWGNVSVANVVASACNGCTDAQYEAIANASAQNSHSLRTRYIYDLVNDRLKAFEISREPIVGGYIYYATPTEPEKDLLSAFTTYAKALQDNGNRSTVFIERHQSEPGFPDPNVSTLDVADFSAYQFDIGAWVTTGDISVFATDATLTINGVVSAVSTILLKQNPLSLNIVLHMVDGGSLTFQVDGGQRYALLIEARDANHNLIPLKASQINGKYIFRDGGGDQFAQYLHRDFGVDLRNYQVCRNGILACTNSRAGRSCEWISCGGAP